MQKTRIICTIGPETESYEMLRKMYDAGMNIVRLNMSHGTHESHAKVIQHIKTLNKKVAISYSYYVGHTRSLKSGLETCLSI